VEASSPGSTQADHSVHCPPTQRRCRRPALPQDRMMTSPSEQTGLEASQPAPPASPEHVPAQALQALQAPPRQARRISEHGPQERLSVVPDWQEGNGAQLSGSMQAPGGPNTPFAHCAEEVPQVPQGRSSTSPSAHSPEFVGWKQPQGAHARRPARMACGRIAVLGRDPCPSAGTKPLSHPGYTLEASAKRN
jgi:hypothetical protein